MFWARSRCGHARVLVARRGRAAARAPQVVEKTWFRVSVLRTASAGVHGDIRYRDVARVLVVEDYPPLAKVVAIAVHREGHKVERVGSVSRALAIPGTFDLAIIDLDLPDGPGTELAEELMCQGRASGVIFFTSTRDQALLRAAELLGSIVDKESGIEELMVRVRREIAQRERLARAVGAEAAISVQASGRSGTRKRVRR